MRKANREVKDIKKIVEVMKKCEVCRIALNDEEYSYILSLSFEMNYIAPQGLTLFLHDVDEVVYSIRLVLNRIDEHLDPVAHVRLP